VTYVREIVQRTDGNPAGGAVAGALIGALIGGRGPAALLGAAGGAAVGASVSQGHSETRRYNVTVQFDDGTMQTFSYGGYSPFNPGEVVVQTPRGLFHG
jgi:outer membrane lipoprotein SlyB